MPELGVAHQHELAKTAAHGQAARAESEELHQGHSRNALCQQRLGGNGTDARSSTRAVLLLILLLAASEDDAGLQTFCKAALEEPLVAKDGHLHFQGLPKERHGSAEGPERRACQHGSSSAQKRLGRGIWTTTIVPPTG